MASATNGGCSGGAAGGAAGVKISLRLQYYLVLAAAGVIVVVVSLAFMSPAAMVAVRQNLGATAAAADASGDRGGARPVLFNFGDSNSDTGGVAAAGGIRITPPEGRTHFHRPTGRLSDGRVIIDFICENLSTHHLNPYLKSVGSDYSNGVNFAMAGSTATHGFSPYSLNVQIDQFLYFKQRSLELFDQGLKGPVDKEGFERALYMMDIGHNDVSSVLHTPSEGWPQKFRDIVGEIKTAVKILYDNGARKFWIHGTGALGCLPAVVSQEKGARDAHGCLAAHNRGVMAFNRLLRDACADMRRRLDGAAVVYTDLFAIKYDLVANHTKYGIEWPLMACCGYGGPPYNMATGKSCSSPGGHLCAPGEKLTSWDGVHYTDYASGVAAGHVLSGEYSTPNIKLASLVHGSNATSDS